MPLPALTSLLSRDGRWLFSTRALRLFTYGFLSVILALYLEALGFDGKQIGLLLTLTLLGDTLISIWLTTSADRFGRKRVLMTGAGLMLLAGLVFAITRNYWALLIAAILGIISPSGNEVGPFLSIEQASLSQLLPDQQRTAVFAWYNLTGSLAAALGTLCGGGLSQLLQNAGLDDVSSYRVVVGGYALGGLLLALLFTQLSANIETSTPTQPVNRIGLGGSQKIVLRLSMLFALDAFAGGLIVQSFFAYWFHLRFGVEPYLLGAIFFGANLLAGFSALLAAAIARRIGLINTMVFTHLPSNLLLMLIPLMPSLPPAIFLLLLRFSISQMDVPTRQSYVMAVVSPPERSAAAGITGISRTTGAALSPLLSGFLLANPAWSALPFLLSGGLKIVYDLVLWREFRAHKPSEEREKP